MLMRQSHDMLLTQSILYMRTFSGCRQQVPGLQAVVLLVAMACSALLAPALPVKNTMHQHRLGLQTTYQLPIHCLTLELAGTTGNHTALPVYRWALRDIQLSCEVCSSL